MISPRTWESLTGLLDGLSLTWINFSNQTIIHWLPRHIAFDDFKSGRFAPSGMSMILMNIENHRTIDIILSRRNRYLRNYFLRYDRAARLAVRTVTVCIRLIVILFMNYFPMP